MFNPSSLASPSVRTLAPYVPGKPLEELEREYYENNGLDLEELYQIRQGLS